MSNTIPVHSTELEQSEENAELFKQLDAKREAGTLAGTRELAVEGAELDLPTLELSFTEKTEAELEKMSKKDLLAYMAEWHQHAEKIAEARAEHAAKLAERAAIHGIPRGKIGEAIEAMLENRPDHPGRGIPYPLLDDDGNERVTKRARKHKGRVIPKGTPVTRMDN